MEKLQDRVFKTSRVAFIGNYMIAGMIVLFIILLFLQFNLTFTFSPQDTTQFVSSVGVLLSMILLVLLIEEPVVKRIMHHFIITNNEIMKVEGLITKKKTIIPYQSVADVRVKKSVFGRIFNYGDLHVTGFGKGGKIHMIGMRRPDEIYNLLQSKINLMRSAFISKEEK